MSLYYFFLHGSQEKKCITFTYAWWYVHSANHTYLYNWINKKHSSTFSTSNFISSGAKYTTNSCLRSSLVLSNLTFHKIEILINKIKIWFQTHWQPTSESDCRCSAFLLPLDGSPTPGNTANPELLESIHHHKTNLCPYFIHWRLFAIIIVVIIIIALNLCFSWNVFSRRQLLIETSYKYQG